MFSSSLAQQGVQQSQSADTRKDVFTKTPDFYHLYRPEIPIQVGKIFQVRVKKAFSATKELAALNYLRSAKIALYSAHF